MRRAPLRGWRSASVLAVTLLAGSGLRPAPALPRGHLLIVGGGAQPESLVRHFVELAGGPGRARIAVVPMASSEAQAAGDEKAEQLRDLGATVVVLNLTRAQAESAGSARQLDSVGGVWFTGGDQSLLVPVLQGTRCWRRSRPGTGPGRWWAAPRLAPPS